MHKSIRLVETPVEFINVTPINPLISKCQIKVCYVGDEPNRNRSIITKETARQMANSLPGSPIVGYFNEEEGDFEEHNRAFTIKDGQIEIKDTTRPYGFVDLGAKVWFAKYLDDNSVEREYLMTEGWLWTGQYPEAKRILRGQGNNQSMELDEETINATWTKGNNGKPQFFIIHEAIISKLCVLGEAYEPCFEGSHITAPNIQFSFGDDFKERVFAMMNELKDLLNKEEQKVFTKYAVTIGDPLWNALFNYVEQKYEGYQIESVCQSDDLTFAVIANDDKYYRLTFSIVDSTSDENSLVLFADNLELIEDYAPATEPQFTLEEIEAYAKSKKEGKEDKENKNKSEETPEGENPNEEEEEKKKKKHQEYAEDKCPECHKPLSECECNKDKEHKYALEEIPEYVELQGKYADLESRFNQLQEEKNNLEAQIAPLTAFKAEVEKKQKQEMIDSFYMLSDEDKQDVIDNIDSYSIDDIESKLSIICVRNKVSFNLDEDKETKGPTTFHLDGADNDDLSGAPDWVKAALRVAETMN